MLPAFALIAAFTCIPFLRAISLSFFVVKRNAFRPSHFMGLTYYLRPKRFCWTCDNVWLFRREGDSWCAYKVWREER